jgi:glycosyltransferase involved in cell wall biosynthesis
MKAPRCTIILPTYNRAAVLPRAISSVIAQNEQDFELIIIDDGSTDNTREWLATLDDARIRVARSEHNQGPSAARNIGISMAAAPMLAFLDSDDIYCKERLSVPLAIFERDPDVICILSSARKEDKRGNTAAALLPNVKLASREFEWAMICDLVGVESTSISVRTEHARKIGGFCSELRRTEDREFLIRLSRLGAAQILPNVLWEKMWSIDGASNQWATSGRDLVSYFRERTEYLSRYRKVGQYLATKSLIMHIRHGDIVSLIDDTLRFYRMGLLDGGIAQLYRSHRQVKRYRRMAQHQHLDALTGPPTDWEL